jgi:hypothetical protein
MVTAEDRRFLTGERAETGQPTYSPTTRGRILIQAQTDHGRTE